MTDNGCQASDAMACVACHLIEMQGEPTPTKKAVARVVGAAWLWAPRTMRRRRCNPILCKLASISR
jgi:cytochrome c peroxidase